MQILRLKEIREDRDISQKKLAEILHTTQQQYSKYEIGIRVIPLEKLCILADYYNVSLDYLVCRTDERKMYPKSKLD